MRTPEEVRRLLGNLDAKTLLDAFVYYGSHFDPLDEEYKYEQAKAEILHRLSAYEEPKEAESGLYVVEMAEKEMTDVLTLLCYVKVPDEWSRLYETRNHLTRVFCDAKEKGATK